MVHEKRLWEKGKLSLSRRPEGTELYRRETRLLQE
jgi:hypothetical protein